MRGAFYNLVNFINTTSINDVYANAARKILQNIYVIPGSTITDVAELCFVSTATISRLCRKLNYESFADFKMDITMNLNYFNRDTLRLQFDHQLPQRQYLHKGKEVFKAHFDNILDNLKETYESVSYEDLEFIVDKIMMQIRFVLLETFLLNQYRCNYRLNYHIWVKNVVGCIL